MENIYVYDQSSYVPAEPIKEQTITEKFFFSLVLLYDVIKVIVLSVPCWFVAAYNLVAKPPKKSISGQTVLVTGGGNGIGKEVALRFAGEGCNIVIADLDFEAAQKSVYELNKMEIIARAYQVDIASTDQLQKLKVDIEKHMSPVEILVNNAAIIPMLSLREGTEEDIERIIKVNVTSHILVTRTFLPEMINRRRGHIVGMASMSSIHPIGGAIIYSASKGAVHNFMIALNEELRQEGNDCIKCTSILPFMVATRKDVVDASSCRFPLIRPAYVAEGTVDAVLRNQLIVTIPRGYLRSSYLMNLLPRSIQMLIRDIVLKEKGTRFFSANNKLKQ